MKRKISEEEAVLNEQKKEYLRQYGECVRAVSRIENQIRELELEEMSPRVQRFDSIPMAAGFSNSDLSMYIIHKDKLITDMIKAKHRRIAVYQSIFNCIENLEDEDEREVLTLRYINGLKWESVAHEKHIEWAQVHRIHARALRNITLPKAAEKDDTQ